MSESIIETMLSRIEHLERANRAMKIIAIGVILGCIALNAGPALSSVFPHGPKQINAESFNLVSPKGVLLATLGQTANGGYLVFVDAKQNPEMTVGTGAPIPGSPNNKSVGMAIFDGNALLPRTDSNPGVARMVWAANSVGGVNTVFGESIFDANAHVRLSNATLGDGSNAGTFFYDGAQTLRTGITFSTNGPGLFLNDSTGAARVLEGVKADDSQTYLAMLNASGNGNAPLAFLSAMGDGSVTTLQVEDGTGVQRAISGFSTGSQEIIQLHNGAGTETFRAPCTAASCP
jgi:hypothetical protein